MDYKEDDDPETTEVFVKPDIEIWTQLENACLICSSDNIQANNNSQTLSYFKEFIGNDIDLNYTNNYVFCFSCAQELTRIINFKTKCLNALKLSNHKSETIKTESLEYTELEVLDEVKELNEDFDWPENDNDSDEEIKSIKSNCSEEEQIKEREIKQKKKSKPKKIIKQPKKRTSKGLQSYENDKKGKNCPVCGLAYFSTQIKHLLAEHGTKKTDLPEAEKAKDGFLIECNICKKLLSDKKTFRAHFVLHSKISSLLQCTYCEEKFSDIGKYKYHIQKHEIPWFECDLCPRRFDRKERLKFHILSRHLKAKRCRICNKLFTSDEKFAQHEQEGCTLHPRSAVCDFCGTNFRNITELKAHLRHMHSNITVYCHICNESFNTEPKLQYHMKTKHEEPKFSCEFCGKRFFFQRAMLRHLEEIHNPNLVRVTCDICNATVKNQRGLLRHKEEVHFSDYRFECPTCGRAFKTIKMLKKHQYSHLKQKPFNCHICGAGYYMTSTLKDHYAKNHSMNYASTTEVLSVCVRVKINSNLAVERPSN